MAQHDESRRRLLTAGGLLLGAASFTARATPIARDGALTRIAFGSCAHQDKEQPIWEAVLASLPGLFVFLGDNIYGDTRDMAELRRKYAQLGAKAGFQRLKATTPLLATWDDHDYGENDAGAEYPMKEESRRAFLEFWEEPRGSPRWSRDGIYTAQLFGPPGRRVQVIMPDLRFNRTPLTTLDLGSQEYERWQEAKRVAGQLVPGPYARSPDANATMLGERQWQWLERQLEVPAELRIVASSLQVLADFPGWEAWINYARDHQRLIEAIRRKRASGVVFISGDTHYAELSRLDVNVPYPLWDLTSSGLTEVWPVDVPNANRVGTHVREPNFGLIEIDWSAATVVLQAVTRSGRVAIRKRIELAALAAPAAADHVVGRRRHQGMPGL
jgi:alkaline phosphatase D